MKKITKVLIFALIAIMLFSSVQTFAFDPYETYTYSIDGEPLESPSAYTASEVLNTMDIGLNTFSPDMPKFSYASDIVTDSDANVYIADKGNNRIVILDKYYSTKGVIDNYIDEYNVRQSFNAPQGVFVTDPNKTADGSSFVYVCDTGNQRIVVFDRAYNYVRTIEKPETNLITSEMFKPMAIAVDIYGRIFVTSQACYSGVIVLSETGDFTGFIGAQETSLSLIDLIWRNFQSKEDRISSVKTLAYPYNNITVDDDGFVYVTVTPNDIPGRKSQLSSITSKSATNSPVKKLNSAGKEIMKRNGFFDPGGEVGVRLPEDVSTIIDVAVGPQGSWSILDSSRSRIFTYDQNGNLLFAFGGKGDQLGNGESFVGMTYHTVNGVSYLLLLDNAAEGYKLTVYSPTAYCDTIIDALRNQNEHNYDVSIEYWQKLLTQNNNFDLAYIGIGKALYQQGKYEEAQEYLSYAYETDYHDKAFMEIRKQIIQKYLLLIVLAVVAVVILIVKFLGYAKKKNKACSLKVGKKTYWEELLYAFHLVFHPFDGFWDLKHEKRGSVRASLTIIGITIVAFFYQAIGQGYSFNPRGDYSTVFIQVLGIAVPVILWCLGNWCLTTLFDGEGSFKDIFVATGYALAPLPVFVILSTVLTNVMTASEGSMVNLLVTFGYVWVALLLFFGTLVTHDYTLGKNFITILGTIVAMVVIMFVVILFSSLVAKIVTFVMTIISEIANRA